MKAEKKKVERKKRVAWTQERAEKICEAIAVGKSYKQAYTSVGICDRTFYKHLKEDIHFIPMVKKAEEKYQEWCDTELVPTCKRSLVELISGYNQKTVKTREYKGKKGEKVVEVVTEEKQLPPNPTAIIFALCNRDPEHWQNRVNNELSGKITTEAKSSVSLASVPDDLLGQVIDAINNGK